MGYYTKYSLDIIGESENWVTGVTASGERVLVNIGRDDETIINRIREVSGYDQLFGAYSDTCKWYEHDETMFTISKEYPDLVFKLHGDGEEAGDQWDRYYKNGKKQECPGVVTYAPYDEKLLK